jgi:hypothetical protein
MAGRKNQTLETMGVNKDACRLRKAEKKDVKMKVYP